MPPPNSFLRAVADHYGEDDPLDLARRLIDQGVPIFIAPPDPASSTGYRLPKGWQTTKASPRALDGWELGWAVCALGGVAMDIVDVDPRNGGDQAAEELRKAGAWPREYLVVSTPSGGTHHYVARLDMAKASRDGIDLQAGATDGTGRGFVFLPPTVRTSKTDNRERPYVAVVDNLDTFGADDHTGAALRSWITGPTQPIAGNTVDWSVFDSGVPGIGTPITKNHDDILSAYAASVARKFPGITLDEAVALVVRRGQDCVPSWESGMRPGDGTLEHEARTRWVPSALKKFATDAEPIDETLSPHERSVAEAAERIRVQEDARRIVADERATAAFREPPAWPTLTEALLQPEEPVRYLVDKLLPIGANAVLTAQFKAGKTTMMNNLALALADGVPFLGRFEIQRPAGRVAIFNYEVGAQQYTQWLRRIGVQNTDAISVVNLRGHRLDLTTQHGEDWAVDWLREQQAAVWIVDPYGRALAGLDENSNSEVGRFVEALDVIKERAGVGELIMPAHTGRQSFEAGEERARGAARIDDWPDARWILTRDDKLGSSFFRATGRDVDVEEEQLTFDSTTTRLTLGGWDRGTLSRRLKLDTGLPKVLDAIRDQPGIGVRALRMALKPMRASDVDALIQEAVRLNQVSVRVDGVKHSHFLTATHGTE